MLAALDSSTSNGSNQQDIASVHFANVMAFRSTPNATHWDFILYTPHGIESHSKSVAALSTLQPPLKAFILMHGTNVVNFPWYLAGIANRGVQNGHELSQILKPRYWGPSPLFASAPNADPRAQSRRTTRTSPARA
jgi:hypothetical protein